MTDALIRAHIPYIPIHADHIARDTELHDLAALVLPNHGAMSDAQADAIRKYVNNGGGLVATGETSRYDLNGQPREDFALADLIAAHAVRIHHGSETDERVSWDEWGQHTYLRITPERRRWVHDPQTGTEPDDDSPRHAAFAGFDDTDITPFGGRTEVVRPAAGAQVVLTLVPPFPIYPPETAWMRQPSSSLPALILNESAGGRVAYLAADIDRTFGRSRLPDHAQLLANIVRWASSDRIPLSIERPSASVHPPPRQPHRPRSRIRPRPRIHRRRPLISPASRPEILDRERPATSCWWVNSGSARRRLAQLFGGKSGRSRSDRDRELAFHHHNYPAPMSS